jgi:hypothetical protein
MDPDHLKLWAIIALVAAGLLWCHCSKESVESPDDEMREGFSIWDLFFESEEKTSAVIPVIMSAENLPTPPSTGRSTFDKMRLVSANAGADKVCIDVEGGNSANGAGIVPWQCHDGDNQKFSMNTKQQIIAAHSGKCLDIEGANGADGARIIQWDCHDGPNQKWNFGLDRKFHSVMDENRCITRAGDKILSKSCNDPANQNWDLINDPVTGNVMTSLPAPSPIVAAPPVKKPVVRGGLNSKNEVSSCEHDTYDIGCADGGVISDLRMKWGRWDKGACPGPGVDAWGGKYVLNDARPTGCNGKTDCRLGSFRDVNPEAAKNDPAVGVLKQAGVEWSCKAPAPVQKPQAPAGKWGPSRSDPNSNTEINGCQHDTYDIGCDAGSKITSARMKWGRWSKDSCPGPGVDAWGDKYVLNDAVPQKCIGQAQCKLGRFEDEVPGAAQKDPAYGVLKQAGVEWTCGPPPKITVANLLAQKPKQPTMKDLIALSQKPKPKITMFDLLKKR